MALNNFAYESGFLNDGNETISDIPMTHAKGLELTIASPIIDAATLTMAKNHYKINHDNDDDAIKRNLRTAVSQIEAYTNRTIVERQITARWKRTPYNITLPRPPHGSISSVKSIDDDGTETTLTLNTDYYVVGNKVKLLSGVNSVSASLEVIYTAGYGKDYDTIPEWATDAVIFQLGVLYSNFDTAMGTRVYNDKARLDERALSACEPHVFYGDN